MKYFLGIVIALLSLSCGGEDIESVPNDLIPKQDLTALLIDLEIMEAYYEQVHKRPNLYKKTLDSASRRIMADHGILETQLKSTLNYYSLKPDSLFLLLESALDSLNSKVIKNKKTVTE
ncbi:MAG: DUF4296 domain-containing protein [Crocinitomicaceae bacterium]